MPLIVVADDDDSPLSADRGRYQRISGQRTYRIQTARPGSRNRRREHLQLFAPEKAGFTSVRVQPREPDGLVRPAESPREGSGEIENLVGPLRCDGIDRILQ